MNILSNSMLLVLVATSFVMTPSYEKSDIDFKLLDNLFTHVSDNHDNKNTFRNESQASSSSNTITNNYEASMSYAMQKAAAVEILLAKQGSQIDALKPKNNIGIYNALASRALSIKKMLDDPKNFKRIEEITELAGAACLEAQKNNGNGQHAFNKVFLRLFKELPDFIQIEKVYNKEHQKIYKQIIAPKKQQHKYIVEKIIGEYINEKNNTKLPIPKNYKELVQAYVAAPQKVIIKTYTTDDMHRSLAIHPISHTLGDQTSKIGSNPKNAYTKTYKREYYKIPGCKKIDDDYQKIYQQLPENKIRKNQLNRDKRAAKKIQLNRLDTGIISSSDFDDDTIHTLDFDNDTLDTFDISDSEDFDYQNINVDDLNDNIDLKSSYDVPTHESYNNSNNNSFHNTSQASSSSNTITNNYETSSLTNQNETLEELLAEFNNSDDNDFDNILFPPRSDHVSLQQYSHRQASIPVEIHAANLSFPTQPHTTHVSAPVKTITIPELTFTQKQKIYKNAHKAAILARNKAQDDQYTTTEIAAATRKAYRETINDETNNTLGLTKKRKK